MFGLITGSGLYQLPGLSEVSTMRRQTPYGQVVMTSGRWRGHRVAFLPRHGEGHAIAPHAINYRANVWALADVGVDAIVATSVSGGISEVMTPGTLVLIDDFINLTSGRADSFFDGTIDPGFTANHDQALAVNHTDMVGAYDPTLRAAIRRAAAEAEVALVDGGVYCATNGPRFETPAEIAMMAAVGGGLVGMTGYPEVALAREAGVPYASIGIISNRAAGLDDANLSIDEIMTVIAAATPTVLDLVARAFDHYAAGAAA